MKKSFSFVCILTLLFPFLILNSGCSKKKRKPHDILDYVDPFIGTGGHGHTFPGATTPFGMVQLSPDNGRGGWDWCSGYNYSDSTIIGFSHTHLSGTGVGDMYDVLITPVTKAAVSDTTNNGSHFMLQFQSHFLHKNEKASPGYYSVLLEDSTKAELTASRRAGMQRYHYARPEKAHVVIDLGHAINFDQPRETYISVVNDSLITGYRYSGNWTPDQRVFFAIRLSKPIHDYYFSDKGQLVNHSRQLHSERGSVIIEPIMGKNAELLIKTGLSSVSIEGALSNLDTEMPGWDFDSILANNREMWRNQLKKITVPSGNKKDKTTFYTALYHTMIAPNLYSDTDGHYRGYDSIIHRTSEGDQYYTFSLWDTFRALHPLQNILNPALTNDFIHSMLRHYEESPDSLLPVWSLWGGETWCMIGYHAVPVIVDAYLKGIGNFDPQLAYQAIRKSAMSNRAGLPLYRKYGYIPSNLESNSVSKTLEYAYDDWCIAQMAKKMGKEKDYNLFIKRAGYYQNLFDTVNGFMRGKKDDSTWNAYSELFNATYTNDYTEGNAWQYSWFVPQDIPGLINLMGGKEKFSAKLDSLFTQKNGPGKNAAVDISGLVGQYVQGNEPSHHVAYLYNYAGKPWKTQKYVTTIMKSLYGDSPDGLCGNDDCGQMSAWYVFSVMGFYPVNPVSGVYELGRPLFPELTLNLPNGKKFTVKAKGLTGNKNYVESVSLNGVTLQSMQIKYADIIKGGILEFEMSRKPVKE